MAVTKRRIKVKSDFSFSSRSKRLVFLLLPTRFSVFLFRRFIDDNRERNALEAAKFLVDANKIYATRYGRLIPKFLRFCLHLADLGLPKDYEKLVIESIWATHQNPKLRKQVNEKILCATSQLSQSDSTAQGWKLLTLALNGFGFIRAGKVSRTNCLHAALNEVTTKKASRRTIDVAIRGLAESRRFNDVRILKDGLPTSHQETMKNNAVETYINSNVPCCSIVLAVLPLIVAPVPATSVIEPAPALLILILVPTAGFNDAGKVTVIPVVFVNVGAVNVYENGTVPPTGVIVKLPSFPPKQLIFEKLVTDAVGPLLFNSI